MIIGINGKIGSGKDLTAQIIQYLTSEENACALMSFETYQMIRIGKNSSWEIRKFAGKLKAIVALLTGCKVGDLEDQNFKAQELPEYWKICQVRMNGTNEVVASYKSWLEATEHIAKARMRIHWSEEAGVPLHVHEFIPTYRWLLQQVGTEAMRNIIHENIWVNSLFADYKSLRADKDGLTTLPGETITIRQKDHPVFESECFPNWIISDMRFPNEMRAIKDRGGITIRINRKFYTENTEYGKITVIPMKNGIVEPSTHPSETALDTAKFDYTINNDSTIENLILKVKEILVKENIL